MKYAYVLAALAAAVHAQTRADIPSCALPCLDAAIAKTDCKSNSDYACICDKATFTTIQGSAAPCVLEKCGQDVAFNKVLPAASALCAAQGGKGGDTSSKPAAGTTTAAAGTTSAAAGTTSAAAETTSAAAGTTTAAAETTSMAAGATTDCSTTMVAQTTPASGNNGTTTPPTTVIPGAAAGLGSMGGLAMLALGALAL